MIKLYKEHIIKDKIHKHLISRQKETIKIFSPRALCTKYSFDYQAAQKIPRILLKSCPGQTNNKTHNI